MIYVILSLEMVVCGLCVWPLLVITVVEEIYVFVCNRPNNTPHLYFSNIVSHTHNVGPT